MDELLASRFLPRRWADKISSPASLPERLQRCVRQLAPDLEWRAYGDADQTFFAVGRARTVERDASCKSMDLYLLDDAAAIYCAGIWACDSEHGWWLDGIVELSFDGEHGWWHAGVMDPKQPAWSAENSQRRATSAAHFRPRSARA